MHEDATLPIEADSTTEQPQPKKQKASKEVKKTTPVKELTPRDAKVQEFLTEYLKTGNGTRSAMKVFNLSEEERGKAQDMAYYIIKTQGPKLVREYLDNKGRGYTKQLDMLWEKMEDAKSPEWWDRLMKIQGYHDFMSSGKATGGTTVNVMNVQKDIMKEYVEGEVIEAELPDEEDL